MSLDFLEPLNVVFVGYFTLLNGGYLVMCGYAVGALRRYGRRMRTFYTHDLLAFDRAPPITLIAPTYNEEAGCVESIRSLLTLNYPNHEVLVVNDGSTDGTLERLREAYDLKPAARYPAGDLVTERVREVYRSESDPDLWVVDKENGGKADALNTGINFCQTPLFGAMDADTLIEREGLLRLARPFLEDDRTVTAGGRGLPPRRPGVGGHGASGISNGLTERMHHRPGRSSMFTIPWRRWGKWMGMGVLLLAVLAGARPEGARAQDPASEGGSTSQSTPKDSAASGLEWSAEIGGGYLHLESPRSPWSSQSAALSASHRTGTYRLGVRREVRFENEEWRLLADVYPKLWRGAYGHLRVAGATPGRTAAEVDGLARLYQTFGRWELSLGGRFMRFPDARTVLSGVGLGRYGVGWYATVGYQLVRTHERTSWGANGLFRWYLGGADTYLDLRTTHGHEVVVVGSGPRTRLLRSTSVGVSLQLPLGGGLSLLPGFRYVNQPGLTRWGGSLALGLDL